MYLQHYGFTQLPFRNTPDPRFFFKTAHHEEALANLIYAVEQRRGFVLLSGEIGAGKTLVTHLLLQHLEDHAQIALIRNTHVNTAQLMRLVCDEFSVKVDAQADKAAMLMALNQFLIQQLAEDRLVVVIIDEAQNLSDKVLEELRMLSNLETSSEKLLQIVMVGQPELRGKVSQPHLEQLRQRIALSYHLETLSLEEIAQYIQHRMSVAAGGGEHRASFTPEAVAKIAKFSRGTPRIINGLCDNALLYGFTAGVHQIDEALIDKVLKQSMHLAPRQHAPTKGTLSRFNAPASRPEGRAGQGSVRPAGEVPAPESPREEQVRVNTPEPKREAVVERPARAEEAAAVETEPAAEAPVSPLAEIAPAAAPAGDAEGPDKKKAMVVIPPIIPFPVLAIREMTGAGKMKAQAAQQ